MTAVKTAFFAFPPRNKLTGLPRSRSFFGVAISPDGNSIVSGADGIIKFWSNDGKLIKTVTTNQGIITHLRLSSDGNFLASGGLGKGVKLWTLDGNEVRTIDKKCSHVNGMNFSSDGKLLATACENSIVRIWNIDGTQHKLLLGNFKDEDDLISGYKKSVESISLSPDNQEFIVANGNSLETWSINGSQLKIWSKLTKVWFTPNGDDIEVHLLENGVDSDINKVIYSPDGKLIASTGLLNIDNSIALWSPTNGLIKELTGHTFQVNDLSFSYDGEVLASASHDQTIRLWSSPGELLKILRGHTGFVNSVSFHPSDTFLASGSYDGMIKLWLRDGSLLETININHPVNKVRFSPDGLTLAVATSDQVILIDFSLDRLLEKGCDRLHNYLKNNPNVSESDRRLCEDTF